MYLFYFEIASSVLFLGMILTVIFKKTAYTSSGVFFLMMLVVGLVTSVVNMISSWDGIGYWTLYVTKMIYLASLALSSLSFCLYIMGITNTLHKLKKHPWSGVLIAIPYTLIIGLLISNYWTSYMFYIEDGVYIRGIFMKHGGVYFCALLYIIFSLVLFICYHKFFSRSKKFAIYFIYPVSIIALAIQAVFPKYPIEGLVHSMALFLIMTMVERPEELFEPELGLRKYRAFVGDISTAMDTGKNITIILVNILNIQTLHHSMSYDEKVNFRKCIGNLMKDTVNDFSLKAQYYWLGIGQFAVIMNTVTDRNINPCTATLRRRLNVPVHDAFSIVDTYSNVALIHSPEDISTPEMCMAFMDSFFRIHELQDDYLDLSDMSNKKDFEIRMHMDEILHQAFINKSFEVFYQPIYSIKDSMFTACEALIRLNDKKYGSIPPSIFIKDAERSGAIHKLGDFVLENVCKFITSSEFDEIGLKYVTINLSMTQCMQEDLVVRFKEITKKYKVDPSKIIIDVEESTDTYTQTIMNEKIISLSEYGFSIALDNYGDGYTKMETISNLPLRYVKLDPHFSNSIRVPNMRIMVENAIRTIHQLNRFIIVEGVESEKMAQLYEQYSCDFIQGFYYSKPLPLADFIGFVKIKNQNNP